MAGQKTAPFGPACDWPQRMHLSDTMNNIEFMHMNILYDIIRSHAESLSDEGRWTDTQNPFSAPHLLVSLALPFPLPSLRR
jgi:hypothetical protein